MQTTMQMPWGGCWVLGQVVLRKKRIILAQTLWKRTIKLAHKGQQGMVRKKARLREKVRWPGTYMQVEKDLILQKKGKCCYRRSGRNC